VDWTVFQGAMMVLDYDFKAFKMVCGGFPLCGCAELAFSIVLVIALTFRFLKQ